MNLKVKDITCWFEWNCIAKLKFQWKIAEIITSNGYKYNFNINFLDSTHKSLVPNTNLKNTIYYYTHS